MIRPAANIKQIRRAFRAIRLDAAREWDLATGQDSPVVMVGTATCGISAGSEDVLKGFSDALREMGIEARLIEVGCMGHCYAEPMAALKKPGRPLTLYGHLNNIIAANLARKYFLEDDPYFEILLGALEKSDSLPMMHELPRYGLETRKLLRRCGLIDPENIHHAIANGAYIGFVNALGSTPEEIVQMEKLSGLRGLGGAGFPAWKKLEEILRKKEEEKYLICNADEGDPGAFMDRAILESDPHAVIEGMLISGYAVGSSRGYVYVRAEYPLAARRVRKAITDAFDIGLLGPNILGGGFDFSIEVVESAGAFVCGEETALIASIEGRRGMPRVRPPYPSDEGLFGKPTLVHNVKSLASIPLMHSEGPKSFTRVGNGESKGTAVFALAGKISNPGLVEVQMGTTVGEVIFEIGGGIPQGRKFKAVQIGGPSGGCMPEEMLDIPIGFDRLAREGFIMGSGGMVVLDEDNCMVDTARYFLEFTQKESCGKCTFCRIGTKHMLDKLTDITEGRGEMEDIDYLLNLARQIKMGSLCNLGKTAPNPVITTIRYFRREYEEHIKERKCSAKVCKALTAYYILPDRCVRSCDACVGSCPPEAIYENSKRIKVVDQDLCVNCNSCMGACPPEYDAVVKISPLSEVPESEPRPEKKKDE